MHANARAAPEDEGHVTNQVHRGTLVQLSLPVFTQNIAKAGHLLGMVLSEKWFTKAGFTV